MKSKHLFLLFVISAFLLIQSCTHDTVIVENTSVALENDLPNLPLDGIAKYIPIDYTENIRPLDLEFADRLLHASRESLLTTRGREVHIIAGSSNALAAAIAGAGAGDMIVLDPGNHTESGTVTIDKSLTIMGYGANLIFSGSPFDASLHFSPAIHITNKGCISTIQGLTFQCTDAIPGVAIFIDQSRDVKIIGNRFENWAFSITLYQSDYCTIGNNIISANTSWKTGTIPNVQGITLSDGAHNQLIRNEIWGAVFGIFTGGSQGLDLGNYTHDCVYGQIMCKVTPGVLNVGGTLINTSSSSARWLCIFNTSSNNMIDGYLVVDGAHHNLLDHIKASNNRLYDIHLAGGTSIFGYFTPTSFENTVIARADLTVKDEGVGNKVNGGTLISSTPPFDLDVTLNGADAAIGYLKFRQDPDAAKIINLDIKVEHLLPNHEYLFQRAVDAINVVDGNCTSSSWLTLGRGLIARSITTGYDGSGVESLWRDITAIPIGSKFDIHFQIIDKDNNAIVLTSDCYQYQVR